MKLAGSCNRHRMAIINTAGGAPLRAVAGTTMLSFGGQGQQVATQATNNRQWGKRRTYTAAATLSPGFPTMDSYITHLDALYDRLADQDPWINYAENIVDEWSLCANCQPDAGGKKLYRQYNFNRFLIGLPRVDVPIDDTEAAEPGADSFEVLRSLTPVPLVSFASGLQNVPTYYLWQIGQQLGNPLWLMPPAPPQTIYPLGTPGYTFFNDLVAEVFNPQPGDSGAGVINACTFDVSGAPGPSIPVEVGWLNW